MRVAVEGVRQPQDVLEILAHRGQAAALRQAVGVQRDQDAGADAADADQAPRAEQQKDLLPGLVARPLAAAGERVDDAAEQRGPRKPAAASAALARPSVIARPRSGASRATTRRYRRKKLILQNGTSAPIPIVRFARLPSAPCAPRRSQG